METELFGIKIKTHRDIPKDMIILSDDNFIRVEKPAKWKVGDVVDAVWTGDILELLKCCMVNVSERFPGYEIIEWNFDKRFYKELQKLLK